MGEDGKCKLPIHKTYEATICLARQEGISFDCHADVPPPSANAACHRRLFVAPNCFLKGRISPGVMTDWGGRGRAICAHFAPFLPFSSRPAIIFIISFSLELCMTESKARSAFKRAHRHRFHISHHSANLMFAFRIFIYLRDLDPSLTLSLMSIGCG